MKRISVPVPHMQLALESLGVQPPLVDEILISFDVIDCGEFDELVMSEVPFNGYQTDLTVLEVITTLFAFWQCAFARAESGSNQEAQAIGAIRSVYFTALNLGAGALVACISVWWEQTAELHGSIALECWS